MLALAFTFHTLTPRIDAGEALRRVQSVARLLQERGRELGVYYQYFGGLMPHDLPKPLSFRDGAMMGPLWEVARQNEDGHSLAAWVDPGDGVVRMLTWTSPNSGKPIEAVRNRPSNAWFLHRATDYAKACGVPYPLQIDRLEPSRDWGRETAYDLWLSQTYRGVRIGEAHALIDGRYGLPYGLTFWPTPNPPNSVRAKVTLAQAMAKALNSLRNAPTRRSKEEAPPLVAVAPLRLVIQRSARSSEFLASLPKMDHSADPYPGVLRYVGRFGRGPFTHPGSKETVYTQYFDVSVDAQTGETRAALDTGGL